MSFCASCGNQILEGAGYCSSCGHETRPTREVAGQHTSGMAVASLILGILGLFLIPLIFSLLAIIFGGVGMNGASKPGVRGHGMAVAGLVLGMLGLIGWISLLVWVFAYRGV